MHAQKRTMDTFWDLDANWKSQGNAIEIKIRLESLSWARNRCTFCYLKKKFCPLPFPPSSCALSLSSDDLSIGSLWDAFSQLLEQVTLDLSANSWGAPGFSGCPLGGPPKTLLQMSALDKSREQRWEGTHRGSAGGWRARTAAPAGRLWAWALCFLAGVGEVTLAFWGFLFHCHCQLTMKSF